MPGWTTAALRLLHFGALAGFAGGLIGLAVIGPGDDPAAAAMLVRAAMLPALGLAVLSGAGLTWLRRLDPRRQPWLIVHAGLALAALGLVAGFIAPTVDLLAALAAMHGGDWEMPAYAALAVRLRFGLAGGLALALAIVAVAIARRPRLRQNAGPKVRNPASAP